MNKSISIGTNFLHIYVYKKIKCTKHTSKKVKINLRLSTRCERWLFQSLRGYLDTCLVFRWDQRRIFKYSVFITWFFELKSKAICLHNLVLEAGTLIHCSKAFDNFNVEFNGGSFVLGKLVWKPLNVGITYYCFIIIIRLEKKQNKILCGISAQTLNTYLIHTDPVIYIYWRILHATFL